MYQRRNRARRKALRTKEGLKARFSHRPKDRAIFFTSRKISGFCALGQSVSAGQRNNGPRVPQNGLGFFRNVFLTMCFCRISLSVWIFGWLLLLAVILWCWVFAEIIRYFRDDSFYNDHSKVAKIVDVLSFWFVLLQFVTLRIHIIKYEWIILNDFIIVQ